MSNKPDPNCEECHGDPKGVLGLHFYTPCTTCNDLPMTGFEKDRATHDLVRELEKPKKAVVVPDDVPRAGLGKTGPAGTTALAEQMRAGAWTTAKMIYSPADVSATGCYARRMQEKLARERNSG